MNIEILEFVEGARKAHGLTVIIDVFRAFSVACYAFDSGAARVIATDSADEAFRLKKEYRDAMLAGERDEKIIAGFDFGNSPTEIIKANLKGIKLIHTTTAGTTGLMNAAGASVLITGSLVNAGAIVKFIRAANPETVSLVAMGYRAIESAEEDLLCADLLARRLRGENPDITGDLEKLRQSSGSRFFNPANIGFSPPTDFFLCTMTDRFSFVLRAEKRFDGNMDLMKIDI